MKPSHALSSAFAAASLFFVDHSSGAFVAYEGFDYPVGQSIGALNGGMGWSSPWRPPTGGAIKVAAAGFLYPGLSSQGNVIAVTPTSANTGAVRTFPPITSGTVYFSVLVDKTNRGTRYVNLELLDDSGSLLGSCGQNSDSITWSMLVKNTTIVSKSAISTVSPIPTFLVLRVDFGETTERMRLYVNPIPGAPEPAVPDADSSGQAAFLWSQISQIRVGSGFANTIQTTSIGTFDEIRIGTEWGDVAKTGFAEWEANNSAVHSGPQSSGVPEKTGDGVPSFLKYALGLSAQNPNRQPSSGVNPGQPAFETTADGSTISLAYVRSTYRTDVNYQIQLSKDLKTWTSIPDDLEMAAGDLQRRKTTVRTKVCGPRVYLRFTASALSASRDLGLETPIVNTAPGAEYADNQRSFAMAMGIERTPKGRIWSVWTGGGDSEAAYLVAASSDDQGTTWSPPRLVIDPYDASNGLQRRTMIGNFWTDPLGRLWLFFDQSMGYFDGRAGLWVIRCDNPDADQPTWTAPRRISDGMMHNKPTVLANGDWLLPVSLWQRGSIAAAVENHFYTTPPAAIPADFADQFTSLDSTRMANVLVSTDQGSTWTRRGGVAYPNPNFNEHMIVELKDGRLWMLARTQDGIDDSFSTNKGVTWSVPAVRIPSIVSRFFIRRLASGNLLLVKNGKIGEILPIRKDMRAFISEDDGRTWLGGLMLDEREKVSYPDGFQAPDGSITVQYDRDRYGQREILTATFTEADARAGEIVSPQAQLKRIVNKGTGP